MKLHYQTVSPILVDCLHKLMAHPAFKDFYLVGGTSLALQLFCINEEKRETKVKQMV